MWMKFSVDPFGPASSLPVVTSQTRMPPCDEVAAVLPCGEKATVWTGVVPAVLVYAHIAEIVVSRPGIFESMKASPIVVGSLDPIGGIRLARK
jgi:hypothetical protein